MDTIAQPLIEAAQRGAPREIERLMDAVWPNAYRLAYSILGDSAAAQDAAQDACITIYHNVKSLRSAAAFRVWTYRIIVRAATRMQRRELNPQEIIEPAPAPDAIEILDLWRALAEIPRQLRVVVVLRYFEDLNSREIADVLGIPDGTVRVRLATAMRRLRPLLSDEDEVPLYAI